MSDIAVRSLSISYNCLEDWTNSSGELKLIDKPNYLIFTSILTWISLREQKIVNRNRVNVSSPASRASARTKMMIMRYSLANINTLMFYIPLKCIICIEMLSKNNIYTIKSSSDKNKVYKYYQTDPFVHMP